jgi:hypothetical protein
MKNEAKYEAVKQQGGALMSMVLPLSLMARLARPRCKEGA